MKDVRNEENLDRTKNKETVIWNDKEWEENGKEKQKKLQLEPDEWKNMVDFRILIKYRLKERK